MSTGALKYRADRVSILLELIDSSAVVWGVGGMGGAITTGLANEVLDYALENNIAFVYVNSDTGDLRRDYKKFPDKLKQNLFIIPVGLSKEEIDMFNSAIRVIEDAEIGLSPMELLKLARTIKRGHEQEVISAINDYGLSREQVLKVIEAVNNIAKFGKRLRGSGKVFENGLEKFRKSYNAIVELVDCLRPETNIVTGSGAGGTGAPGIPTVAKAITETVPDSMIVISMFKPRKIDGALKMKNYARSIAESHKYANLLIEHDIDQFKSSTPKEINNQFAVRHAHTLYFLMRIYGYVDDENIITNVDPADFATALEGRGKTMGEFHYIYDRITNPEELKEVIIRNLNEKVASPPDKVVIFADIPSNAKLEDFDAMLEDIIDVGRTDVFWGLANTESKNEVWIYYLPLYSVQGEQQIQVQNFTTEFSEIIDYEF